MLMLCERLVQDVFALDNIICSFENRLADFPKHSKSKKSSKSNRYLACITVKLVWKFSFQSMWTAIQRHALPIQTTEHNRVQKSHIYAEKFSKIWWIFSCGALFTQFRVWIEQFDKRMFWKIYNFLAMIKTQTYHFCRRFTWKEIDKRQLLLLCIWPLQCCPMHGIFIPAVPKWIRSIQSCMCVCITLRWNSKRVVSHFPFILSQFKIL